MSDFVSRPCTAFAGNHRVAQGPLIDVALAVKAAEADFPAASILIFDDATGAVVDLDLRGSAADITERLSERAGQQTPAQKPRGKAEGSARLRGRPRLGVVAREVTLLPRHWEWLAAQPGGASQALRRLVDEARRTDGGTGDKRRAQEAAYRFMSAMAGNLPGFEEASRALFAGNAGRFTTEMSSWPADIRDYARKLASPGRELGLSDRR